MTDKYRKVKINTTHDVLHDPENRKKHCVRRTALKGVFAKMKGGIGIMR